MGGATTYEIGQKGLIDAIQDLSLARDLPAIQAVVRRAARQLVGADGATFVLRDGDRCYYADEDAIAPLWKGQRFPLEACISGWSMLNKQPTVIPDIYADERIPHEAYRPTFVQSLVMVPIRTKDPIGAIGVYWAAHHGATLAEVDALQALANATAVAMENVALLEELEQRVADRTAELAAANAELSAISYVDELTGLLNRRGFLLMASHELELDARAQQACALLFLDVDGLKDVNDRWGHETGDRLLQAVAKGMKGCLRSADLVARLSGDEFAVLLHGLSEPVEDLVERIRLAIAADGPVAGGELPEASIGLAFREVGGSSTVDDLLRSADKAMYEDKRRRQAAAQTA